MGCKRVRSRVRDGIVLLFEEVSLEEAVKRGKITYTIASVARGNRNTKMGDAPVCDVYIFVVRQYPSLITPRIEIQRGLNWL